MTEYTILYIGKNAKVKYGEKHYGEGSSESTRILNPTTIVHMEEDSYCEMDMTQIKGVNSTKRETEAFLGKGAKLIINEKLMTHDNQIAHSNVKCNLNGEDSILQIISRSVAKDKSVQVFHPIAIGNDNCKAHTFNVTLSLWIKQKLALFQKFKQIIQMHKLFMKLP